MLNHLTPLHHHRSRLSRLYYDWNSVYVSHFLSCIRVQHAPAPTLVRVRLLLGNSDEILLMQGLRDKYMNVRMLGGMIRVHRPLSTTIVIVVVIRSMFNAEVTSPKDSRAVDQQSGADDEAPIRIGHQMNMIPVMRTITSEIVEESDGGHPRPRTTTVSTSIGEVPTLRLPETIKNHAMKHVTTTIRQPFLRPLGQLAITRMMTDKRVT